MGVNRTDTNHSSTNIDFSAVDYTVCPPTAEVKRRKPQIIRLGAWPAFFTLGGAFALLGILAWRSSQDSEHR